VSCSRDIGDDLADISRQDHRASVSAFLETEDKPGLNIVGRNNGSLMYAARLGAVGSSVNNYRALKVFVADVS
jgi:hypothetical protein